MGFDSMGMMGQATGTVSGNTWSWTGEDKMGGKLIKSKYTIVMRHADLADVQVGDVRRRRQDLEDRRRGQVDEEVARP